MRAQAPTNPLFDQWAAVYDTQTNPLLALEARCLPLLFPPIAGAHVLDAGCGTGRWLATLEAHKTASLTGCDPSAGMLARARNRLAATTQLYQASASNLPAANASLDIVLSSFVVSYLDDLLAFASECLRTLKPGGTLLLSDMHPVTAAQRGWTRSFRVGEQAIHIAAYVRSLDEVLTVFRSQGFTLIEMAQPSFEEPERSLFDWAGKLAEYTELQDVPAIYVLKLQKPRPLPATLIFSNTRLATSSKMWSAAPTPISNHPGNNFESLDLTGYVLLPGLINAHDHLEFALFPNLGRAPDQPPYTNSPEWAREIHRTHAAVIARHQAVPLATRLAFGALRNLLCGVTTVCHHNPLHPELLAPDFPVRVVRNVAWAHSLTFDANLKARFDEAPADSPFVLHAAEGTDAQSRDELYRLDALGLLTQRTVLVHGLALADDDIALLNIRGASLILCPTSNRFLFDQVITAERITAVQRAALGSDSPLTAAGDLLDELHALQALAPELLYNLVTTGPAEFLHLPQTPLDLIAVVERPGLTPAEVVAQLNLADVELVLVEGRVQVASPGLYNRLSVASREGLYLLEIHAASGPVQRWVRAPLPELFASAEAVLGHGRVRLGNKEVRYLPTA